MSHRLGHVLVLRWNCAEAGIAFDASLRFRSFCWTVTVLMQFALSYESVITHCDQQVRNVIEKRMCFVNGEVRRICNTLVDCLYPRTAMWMGQLVEVGRNVSQVRSGMTFFTFL